MNESPELVLDGGEPICQQIETQVRRFISIGHLRPGEELPTVRALAVGLAINPRTVAQAYARLEQMGLLASNELGGPRVAQSLSGKPLAPASGERGWGEGACFSRGKDPLTPNPSPPSTGERGALG